MAGHLEALKLASETMQGLITISTALIGLTVTFRKDLLGNTTTVQRYALAITFILLVLSMAAALFTQSNIVAGADSNNYGPSSAGIKHPAQIAALLFLGGIVGYGVVGILALTQKAKPGGEQQDMAAQQDCDCG